MAGQPLAKMTARWNAKIVFWLNNVQRTAISFRGIADICVLLIPACLFQLPSLGTGLCQRGYDPNPAWVERMACRYKKRLYPIQPFLCFYHLVVLLYFFDKCAAALVLFRAEVFPLGLYFSVQFQFGIAFGILEAQLLVHGDEVGEE